MSEHAPTMPHGPIEEVFEDIHSVTGTMRGEFFGSMWQFNRNMTIVREDGRLTLVNAVRLDDAGLAALEALGEVAAVARIGSMHGHDDAFYVERYGAAYWALPGMPDAGVAPTEVLSDDHLPFASTLFVSETTKLPEAILRIDREGGIAIACDSLQNWVEPDELFLPETVETMRSMGFFTPANLGPAWMHVSEPKAADFTRLKEMDYRHALFGHGTPLRDTAGEDFRARFAAVFDV